MKVPSSTILSFLYIITIKKQIPNVYFEKLNMDFILICSIIADNSFRRFYMSEFLHINWEHIIEILWLPVCIQIIALIIGLAINRFVNMKIHSRLNDSPQNLHLVLSHALKGVPISLCSGIGLYWTLTSLDNMTPKLQDFLSNILLGIIFFTITRVLARIAVGVIDMHTQANDSNMPKTTLLTNIVEISIYVMGALILLQSYGISITPIITALGIGGMALALGLQDMLANIFAGIHLILSKQIRLGDYIRLSNGQEGRVQDISWRFTTIEASTKNVIVIPNQQIASAILTNYSMPAQDIAIVVPVGVSYDSNLDEVERITLDVAKKTMEKFEPTLENYHPLVRFHTFADSSINFNVILHSGSFVNQHVLKHEFIKALTARYRQDGINIPFPIRTIQMESKE